MANGIGDYNRGYRRTDLTDVGQKIKALSGASDATILDSLVGLSLQIAQNAYLDKKSESRQNFNTALKSTASALKALDHTQSGVEVTDSTGTTYDIYDRQYDLAKLALTNLKDFQDDPALKKQRPEINLAINEFAELLSHKDAMKNQREGYLDNLEDLGNDYMDLVKSDPSMTDPDDWSNAKDIIDDVELGYANLLANSGKKIPAAKAIEYSNLLKTNEMLMRAREGDMNKTLEGFQVDLTSKGSPYLQSFFKQMGMIDVSDPGGDYDPETETTTYGDEWYASWVKGEQIETPAGQATYMPPKARVPAPGGGTLPTYVGDTFPPVSAFEAPDTELYKEATAAFNKWEQVSLGVEATELALEGEAPDYAIFDMVENFAADPTKASIAMLIGHGTWGDIENEPLEDLPAFTKLSDKNQKIVTDAVKTLDERGATGKFRAEENALQTKINAVLPKIMSRADKLGRGIVNKELANQIEFRGKTLNEDIKLWNDKYTSAQDMDLPNIPVLVPDEATLDAVIESKVSHVELFENMIRKEIKDEGWFGDTALSADPTGNIRALLDSPDAPMEDKWALMYNLTTEFLYSGGGRNRRGDVEDMFDGDTDRMNLFYNTLKSFQKLMEAEPLGTSSLRDKIGLDIEEKSAMEEVTGLSGLSGLLLNM